MTNTEKYKHQKKICRKAEFMVMIMALTVLFSFYSLCPCETILAAESAAVEMEIAEMETAHKDMTGTKDTAQAEAAEDAKNTEISEDTENGEENATSAALKTLSEITGDSVIQTYGCTLSDSVLQKIQEAIDAYDGIEVEFTMIDLVTGQAISYNATTTMYSASAIKGPYIISVLSAGYPEDQNMYNAIVYSDNYSYAACVDTYGKDIFTEWFSSCGAESTTMRGRYADTTSLDLAKMWTKAYDYFQSDADTVAWAADVFREANCSAISQALPQYTVYSKAGWIDEGGYYNVYTNAGIVLDSRDGGHPYVISIMSRCTGTEGIPQTEQLSLALDMAHWEMIGRDLSQYIEPDEENITYQVYVTSLKVLTGADKRSRCIGLLPKGTKVKVLEISGNYWGKIEYNGSVGWICLAYCRK